MTEKELSEKIIFALKQYFSIEQEVWSKDGKSRIDFVLTCKLSGAVFGLEIKKIDKKRGDEVGKIFKQCLRYAKSEFNISGTYNKIPIFLAPPLSYNFFICPDELQVINNKEYFCDRHFKDHEHHSVNGFIGNFNVGELRTFMYNDKKYMRFMMSNKIIWTNKKQWNSNGIIGLHTENYNYLLDKIKNYGN